MVADEGCARRYTRSEAETLQALLIKTRQALRGSRSDVYVAAQLRFGDQRVEAINLQQGKTREGEQGREMEEMLAHRRRRANDANGARGAGASLQVTY